MSSWAKKQWQRVLVAAALLATIPVGSHAQSLSCFTSKQFTVCRCTSCTYIVACKIQIGFPSVFAVYDICTGTNPGFVIMSAAPAVSGLSSQTASFGFGCGSASLVGPCCGGTRTTTLDASIYMVTTPSGVQCGAAGTSGTGA